MGEKLLTVEEAAAIAKLSFMTIYRAISNTHLEKVTRGRRVYISEAALLRWFRAGAKTGRTKFDVLSSAQPKPKAPKSTK